MAFVDHDAILTAIREICDSGTGNIRTIAAARFQGGAYRGQSPGSEALYSLAAPTFRTAITGQRRHPDSPPITSTLGLYEIDVQIEVIRTLELRHKLTDSIRDDAKALAANDADVLAQALSWPGNLTQTSGADPTGLVSGYLAYISSDGGDIILSDDINGRIVSTHNFTGIVQVTLAVS